MQARNLPRHYVFDNRAGMEILPLVAFFPLVIIGAIFIGMTLTNQDAALEEWRVPLLGIGGISLTGFTIGIVFEMAMRWWNIHQIKQVYSDPWAVWVQYKEDDKWRAFIESNYQKEMKQVSLNIVPLIIVGLVVIIMGGAMIANGIEFYVLFGLVGFMGIVVAIVVGEWLTGKWRIRSRYKRRKNSPPPATLISEHGHYNEDQGYDSLNNLQSAELKRSGKRGRAKINFVTKARWFEVLNDEYMNFDDRWRVVVDVPKGDEADAETLVTRFQIEVLI